MKKGFTLIELLAVIAIIGVLAVITTPIITGVIENARESTRKDEADSIAKTINMKMLDEGISISGVYTKVEALDNLGIKINGDKIIVTLVNDVPFVSLIVDNKAYLSNNMKVYGLKWDGNATYTRLDDAVGMVANVGVDSTTVRNDFDDAQIYSEMKTVIEDGNSFVKIPKFYIKKVVNGAEWKWYVSKVREDEEYYLPACFMDETNNKELDYILVGKYDAALEGTKLVSKTNTIPLVSKNINEFRTYALNNNVDDVSGYQLIDIHTIDTLQVLFYVEFGTLNSQSIMMGNVSSNAVSNNGLTDSVLASSGSKTSNTDGLNSMKYRGIENLYGNIFNYIDGINIDNDTNKIYVNKNASTYASDIINGDYVYLNYSKLNTEGFITKMGYDINNPSAQLPVAVGGTATTKYADSYLKAITGKTVVRFGGYHNYGYSAGISAFVNTHSSTNTTSATGSRLVKTPS